MLRNEVPQNEQGQFESSLKLINQQRTFGSEMKKGKAYPNANFDDLCIMSDEQKAEDLKAFRSGELTNYFDNAFKKQFKVHKINDKLYFHRYGEYIPLRTESYGFVVSPKGSIYAVACNGTLVDKGEIQNARFMHSLFLAGQPVQTAGFFTYNSDSGVIESLYRDSGHYKPTFGKHVNACLGLVNAGYLTTDAKIGGMSFGRGKTYSLQQIMNNSADYSDIIGEKITAPTTLALPPTDGKSLPHLISNTTPSVSRLNRANRRYTPDFFNSQSMPIYTPPTPIKPVHVTEAAPDPEYPLPEPKKTSVSKWKSALFSQPPLVTLNTSAPASTIKTNLHEPLFKQKHK